MLWQGGAEPCFPPPAALLGRAPSLTLLHFRHVLPRGVLFPLRSCCVAQLDAAEVVGGGLCRSCPQHPSPVPEPCKQPRHLPVLLPPPHCPGAEDKATTLFTAPEALRLHHPFFYSQGRGDTAQRTDGHRARLRKSPPDAQEQQKILASHSQRGEQQLLEAGQTCLRPGGADIRPPCCFPVGRKRGETPK